ncbi:hypothetical protein [Spirillospora sp. NPDC029432]
MTSASLANPRRTRIDAWPRPRTETPDPRAEAVRGGGSAPGGTAGRTGGG